MAKFIILSALLSLAATQPIIVPNYNGQLFVPIFRHQFFQQPFFFNHGQDQIIDRADQEGQQQTYSPELSPYSNFEAHDNQNYNHNPPTHEETSEQVHNFADHNQQDYSAFTDFQNGVHENEESPDIRYDAHSYEPHHNEGGGHHYVQSVPVSEHVEVTKPIAVPVYKEIGVPVPQPVKINVPHPVAVGVPQPYPVAVPVSQPVPIQIIKTVAVPVEKKVPYPVEKHIPVPVEKPVPIKIEKHIPVPVYKPYPIKVPVYKTIYHHAKSESKGHGGHSHGHAQSQGH